MVIVYVIESIVDEAWYTSIALDDAQRLKEHDAGKNSHSLAIEKWQGCFLFSRDLFCQCFYVRV
jgi:predicted GIY-YIG superfamily endonuclease